MSDLGVFSGAALVLQDKAKRLALPAVLRNSIPDEGKGRQLFVTTHEVAPCLIGSGVDRKQKIAERLDRAERDAETREVPFDRFKLQRRLLGPGETVPMDGSGRFILSDLLAEVAEFQGEVFFFGTGPWFEMWDLQTLLAQTDETYVDVQRAARAALRARDRKAKP